MYDVIVSETLIRRDDDGRYCLNDLHRAAGAHAKHKPGNWLALKQTRALADEIGIAGIPAITSVQGVGTYVARELVYAYAMWISPAFALKVIRTYDAMQQQALEHLKSLSVRRARAELELREAEAEASRCGLGLRRWRDIGPSLEARIQALQDESQPSLFLN